MEGHHILTKKIYIYKCIVVHWLTIIRFIGTIYVRYKWNDDVDNGETEYNSSSYN